MTLSLSHIAIACPSINEMAARLEAIRLKVEAIHEVKSERVRAAFVPVVVSDQFRIELVEPTDIDSPIGKFLQTRPKGGLHHLSFRVENIDKWKSVLEAGGITIIPPGIRDGARGRALFIHPREMAGVLIELEELNELPTQS